MVRASNDTINANIGANVSRSLVISTIQQPPVRNGNPPMAEGYQDHSQQPSDSTERVDRTRNEINVEAKSSRRLDCSGTSILVLTVACMHISVALWMAANATDKLTKCAAFVGIVINLLLAYGAVFCRKVVLIGWLAFYIISGLAFTSSICARNAKVRNFKWDVNVTVEGA